MILAQVRYHALRRAGGYVDGYYQITTLEVFGVEGSLQPLDPRSIELLPDELKQRAAFKFYVPQGQPRLRVGGNEGGELGDMVWIEDRWFEIHNLTAYDVPRTPGFDLAHRKFALVGPNRAGGTPTPWDAIDPTVPVPEPEPEPVPEPEPPEEP